MIIENVDSVRIADTFLSYTPVASSTAAGFPASNIQILERPLKTWRSTATGIQNIVLDFTTAKTPPVVFLDNVNFATVQIQGNATDSWGAPSFDSGSVTIEQDPELRRYKRLIALTAFNYRYMRILIPSQTPTDGAAYYKMGAVVVPSIITKLNESVTYPGRWNTIDAVLINEFLSRGFETVNIGSGKAKILTVDFRFTSDDANIKQVYDFLGDRMKTILFDYNFTTSWESYLCRPISDLERNVPSANPTEFRNVQLRIFI